jgi:hypothetical protein
MYWSTKEITFAPVSRNQFELISWYFNCTNNMWYCYTHCCRTFRPGTPSFKEGTKEGSSVEAGWKNVMSHVSKVCKVNTFLLLDELPPKIIPYFIIEWK